MIRVLVVDDSAFMRKALSLMLERDSQIKVVGTARDGEEGFQKVLQYRPDVVTLDMEMPRTDGLTCIKMIMEKAPTPILVVSSITTKGAATTLKAMDLGAVDYIPKTQSFVAIDITKIEADLIAKVKSVASSSRIMKARRPILSRVPRTGKLAAEAAPEEDSKYYNLKSAQLSCVAIGVSTGGPPVVQSLLTALPESFKYPILIAQHMPKEFTDTFARRLDSICKIHVKEAEDGEKLVAGTAYIGRGGDHLLLKRRGVHVYVTLTPEPKELLYHPSADVMFDSAVQVYGSRVLGLILTGMGKDGVLGLAKLHEKKGIILAQNEATCIVYGMPKAAVDASLTTAVLSVDGLVKSLATIT